MRDQAFNGVCCLGCSGSHRFSLKPAHCHLSATKSTLQSNIADPIDADQVSWVTMPWQWDQIPSYDLVKEDLESRLREKFGNYKFFTEVSWIASVSHSQCIHRSDEITATALR